MLRREAGRNDLAWDGESKRIIAVGDGRETYVHAYTLILLDKVVLIDMILEGSGKHS